MVAITFVYDSLDSLLYLIKNVTETKLKNNVTTRSCLHVACDNEHDVENGLKISLVHFLCYQKDKNKN